MCDAFLVLAQAEGGALLLPDAPLRPRTASATASASSGSRTSSATAPTPPARSSSTAPGRGWSARRARGVPDDHRDGQPHPARLRDRGSATGMRAGVAQAINHAAHRSTFGKLLVEQPLMQNVLADLAVESEAATISSLRLARAYDEAHRRRRRRPRPSSGSPTPCSSTGSASAARPRGRVPRVPRRQRLRRGVRDAPPLPRERRSPRSGRARATSSASTSCGRWCKNPDSVEAFFAEVDEGAGEPRLDAYVADASRADLAGHGRDRVARPPAGRADGARAPGLAPAALRRRGGRRTPSARRASPATGATPSEPCRPAPTSRGSSTATAPSRNGTAQLRAR